MGIDSWIAREPVSLTKLETTVADTPVWMPPLKNSWIGDLFMDALPIFSVDIFCQYSQF